MSKPRVLHIITGLGVGGAEHTLLLLLESLRREFTFHVATLADDLTLSGRAQELGASVTSAGIRRVTPSLKLLGFLRWMRSHDADLVQTWMYHGDLVGGFYRLTGGRSPVVWNVRRARFGRRTMKAPTRLAAQACACLSHIAPARIVVNSLAGAQFHQRRGYAAAKMTVIPNGVDTRVFKPDPAARGNLRRKLALKEDAVLVAHVARYHPSKDHATFVAAAARLLERLQNAHIVMVGRGVDDSNVTLRRVIESAAPGRAFHLLGERQDVACLMPAFDLLCSTSEEEAFPNVVAEAMACGVPCVATDVGDTRRIVGDTGHLVAPGDPVAMCEGAAELLELPGERKLARSVHARRRIEADFSLETMAQRYADLWRGLLSNAKRR